MLNKLHIYFKPIRFILIMSLIVFLITFIFPVKFCVKTLPINNQQKFYIVRFDCLKNWWVLAGDSDGLYDWNTISDTPVYLKGNNFQKKISGDLYLRDMPTYFIVWGDAEVLKEYDEEYDIVLQQYVINCTDWNVLNEVNSRNTFRMNFSNKYLTIYDYKWFDDFRSFFWYYEEY